MVEIYFLKEDLEMRNNCFTKGCGALVCGGSGGIDPQPTQAQVEESLVELAEQPVL